MATRRWGWFLLVLVLVSACSGCDPLEACYFLFAPDPKIDPTIKKVAADDPKKQVRVVVFVFDPAEVRPNFIRPDRELANGIVRRLREAFKDNGENVDVVSASKVETYKNKHPYWRTTDWPEIGEEFQADYVLYLEIGALSLFERHSTMLYHGHAEIAVNLIDVHDSEESDQKQLVVDYPSDSRGEVVPRDDMSSDREFIDTFFKEIATQVAWCVASHPTSDRYRCQ